MRHPRNTRLFVATSFFVLLVLASFWAPLYALLALKREAETPPQGKRGNLGSSWSVARAARPAPPLQARFDARGSLSRLYFPIAAGLAGDLEHRARMLLEREVSNSGVSADPGHLELVDVRWSPSGPHVRFQEMEDGIPVWGGEAVVSFNNRLEPLVLALDLLRRPHAVIAPEKVSAAAAIERARRSLQIGTAILGTPTVKKYRRAFGATWVLAWRVGLACEDPMGDWEVWVDAHSGTIHEFSDRTLYLESVESVEGRGQVFVPDPVFASGDQNLQDLDDSDAAVPASTYESVALHELDPPVEGLYSLSGPYVCLEDWEDPRGAPASAPTPDFFFTRGHQSFEDVMVYYHIDSVQRWYQSLGFMDANNRQQAVDAHGFRGLDNSKYVPSLRKLSFGEGGVDDAEDAAVIVHEYGHATQHNIVPTWGLGGHEAAMGEGFGDYLANSYAYSRYPDRARDWNGVFQWDGHNEFWPGRPVINPALRYPDDAAGAAHQAGTLWCSALTDALYLLGDRGVMDRLVLDHHYALTGSATMEDAANAIIVADFAIYEGIHVPLLTTVFARWGMLDLSEQSAIALEHTPLDIATNDEGVPEVSVRVVSNLESLDPASAKLYVRLQQGDFFTVPMQRQAEDTFATALPISPGSDVDLEYYVEVGDTLGRVARLPLTSPLSTYSFSMGWIAERFETNAGWQTGAPEDDAVRGTWVRTVPVGTPAQPGLDHTYSGSHCFVTGNVSPGMPMSEADVDGGQTSLYSPRYDVRGAATVLLRYWRWFSNDQGTNPGADPWQVQASSDAGETWVELENTLQSDARWRRMEFDLTAALGPMEHVQLRFIASDRGESSIVEAAIDDLLLLVGFTTAVQQGPPRLPLRLTNDPNPFNPNTTIRFALEREIHVRLDVYDSRGSLVRCLVRGRRQRGSQRVLWDGRDDSGQPAASGTYFLRLRTPEDTSTRKATLLR